MHGRTRRLVAASLTLGLLSGCADLMTGMRLGVPDQTAPMMAKDGNLAAGGTGESGAFQGGVVVDEQGTGLKGGERDDNADFAGYLEYLGQNELRYDPAFANFRVDVSERYPLWIVDAASKSVPNALVTFKLGSETVLSARTPADGRLYFHPKAFPLTQASTADLTVEVTKGAETVSRALSRNGQPVAPFELPSARGPIPPKVDICFVLDVTGSMGDELSKIQATIGEIAARIKSLPGQPSVRFGLVAYRDHGDDFVTREHDFTENLDTFKSQLNSLAAVGGGDYPEALNPALDDAVNHLTWDEGESVRLAFVVGDAPPHFNHREEISQDIRYTRSMVKAVSKGIKLYPLAASGLDAKGEYVFRQLAQFTGGKFLFLTYGGGTSHQVGPVQENNLDDLVVGIVKAELSHLD